ncbi:phage tail protein [Pseudomonas yamanorum]|uniref:phage tail protein n=2 Tax=Bacteria TaxID=2 RepID=UPI00210BC421|nr:phage tail protein [Pseudomonas yamanorum]
MADFYTLLTNDGIAYETACKAAGLPIKLAQISVGDGNGAVYNPDATAKALKREVWRGPLNALFQDEKNPSWLLAEVTIPSDVGGWYVREAGIWTDNGVLYAIVKYPESFKPVLATSGSGKEFYIRSIFETSNASLVTLLIDDTVVKATRAWVVDYLGDELAKLDSKQSVRVAATANIVLSGAQQIDGVAVIAGQRVLVAGQTLAKDNGIYIVANSAWSRSMDASSSQRVTPGLSVIVEEGTAYGGSLWQLVSKGVIALGSTPLAFEMLAGRSGVQAGTYKVLTVDKYGRTIGGTNPGTLAEMGIRDAYTKDEIASMFGKLTDESKLPLKGGTMTGAISAEFSGMGGAFVDWQKRIPAIQINCPINSYGYSIWKGTMWGERHLASMDVYSGGTSTSLPVVALHMGAVPSAFLFEGQGNLTIKGAYIGEGGQLLNLNASALTKGAVPAARLQGSYDIDVSGNSGTTSRLATPRQINGVSFDGTANIAISDNSKLPTTGGLMSGTASFELPDMGGGFVAWRGRSPAVQINAPANYLAYLVWRATCWNERHLAAMEAYSGGTSTSPPQVVTHVGGTNNAMTLTEGGHLSISGIYSGNAAGLTNLPPATADVPGAVLKNTASLGPNGWWKCAQTGMIKQWGITLGASDTVTHRSFPIAFPNRCASLVASRTSLFYSDAATGTNTLIVSNTQFSVISGPFNSPDDIYWEATGY